MSLCSTQCYLVVLKWIIKMEKPYQFVMLSVLLIFSLTVDFRNAAAIQENTTIIKNHSEQLDQLNDKFNSLIVLASNVKSKNDEQDEKLKKLEEKDKEQDNKLNGQDDKNKEQDSRINELEKS